MSAIQSSVGLITGIPIQDTVDQLISVASRPRNLLSQRNQGLTSERSAIDQLSSLTLSTKFSLNRLNLSRTFNARSAQSSDSAALSARVRADESPQAGSYRFTPLKLANSHQLVSGRLDDLDNLGSGSLSLQFGGQVDRGVALSELNGGDGFDAGRIKITDRAGQTAVIDLRGAQSVDDVLQTINEASEIDVIAGVEGDRFTLTDNSGESGTLRVREVDGGSTASSLGLVATAASDSITGQDIYGLSAETTLSSLNDGLGIAVNSSAAADLTIELADGKTASLDLSEAKTLGDVIDAINESEDLGGLLTASLNAEGNGLVLEDTSTGAGALTVLDGTLSTAATDLGVATVADGEPSGTISGDRLISGLKDTLVSTLRTGGGVELGEIEVTDRAGAATTIDLSSAETLGEVIGLINASGAEVTADFNNARNGLVISDESGGAGSLTIANGSAGSTADDLGIAIDSAVNSVDSGSLGRRVVGAATRLADFNGGGVVSDIRITDSSGSSSTINLSKTDDDAETLGEVIERINAAGVSVTARINDTGDGILLTDDAGGDGVLSVAEVGSGGTAAQLGLLGDSATTNDAGAATIDGATGFSIDLSDLDNSARSTSLAGLNGGSGVDLDLFEITNSRGENFVVDLGQAEADAQTIGDVIDRINEAGAGFGVTARLNDAQSGIVLEDGAGGDEELTVTDFESSSTAADLKLLRTGADTDDTEIDGRGLFTFNGDNALQTLADRINEQEAGVTASVFNDGAGFRLSLTSDRPGAGNELLIDGLGTSLGFTETTRPSDAVAQFGGVAGIGGFTVTSDNNEFVDVIDGVTLTAEQATGETVTVDVSSNDQPVIAAVQEFVNAYNSLRDNIDATTDFDADSATTGILFGRSEVLSVESSLSRLLTDTYFIEGERITLAEIGLGVDDNGRLELDSGRLSDALAEDPARVESLFRDENRGVVAKLDEAIDALAGDENSVLSARSSALTRTIEQNELRLEDLDAGLERQRERLLLDFFRLEETIGQLQSNTSFLDSIVPVTFPSN